MRIALFRARKNQRTAQTISRQQSFDRGMAALVRALPVPPATAEWFINEKLIAAAPGRPWKRTVRNPAVIAAALALGVILGIGVHNFLQHMEDFPGASTARKLLTVAGTTRVSELQPVETDAGDLADLLFMKYRLEHYDVPPEFARFRTIGYRVFDDDEGHRVAQIEVSEKRMQFFLFPSEKQTDRADPAFTRWKYVDGEGWVGAVQQHQGICFMAALRGRKKDLASYLPRS